MSLYVFRIYLFMIFLIIFANSNNQIAPYKLFLATAYDKNTIILFTENEIHLLYSNFSSYQLLYNFSYPSIPELSEYTHIRNFPELNGPSLAQIEYDTYIIFPKENNIINYPYAQGSTDGLVLPYICNILDENFNCTYFDLDSYTVGGQNYFSISIFEMVNDEKKLVNFKIFIPENSKNKSMEVYRSKISCELMESAKEKNNDIIVYFYQISNELVATSFEIISLYENNTHSLNAISNIFLSNIELYYIKTLLSPDSNNITLISYISTEDNSLYCLLYNSIEKYFTKQKKFLTDCKTNINDFGIVKDIKNKNQKIYLAYCYQNDTKIQYILINETFIENGDEEKVEKCNFLNIEECTELYSSTVIFINEKYYLMYSCKNSSDFNFTGQKELDVSNFIWNKDKEDYIIEFEDLNSDIITGKIKIKKDELIEAISGIIDSIQIGKKYEIKGEDFDVKIHPINEGLGENTTFINFSNCESKLRNEYNLSNNSILTTLQIEIQSKIKNSLTNQVEYAIFDDKKNKLNLSICTDSKVNINYEINDPSVLDKNLISSFSDKGIDILDSKNEFFNDICFSYNENNTDVILSDRISNIYQNYSLCGLNCLYENINLTLNMIKCSCDIKTNISTEEEAPNFAEMVGKTFKNTNFAIIKCYKSAFTNLSSNIGFIVFALLLIFHIPLFSYYLINGVTPVINFITKEMIKNNYIIDNKTICQKLSNPIYKNKKQYSVKNVVNNNVLKNNSSKKIAKISSESDMNILSFKKDSKMKKITKNVIIEDKEKNNWNLSNKKEERTFQEKNFPGYYNLILINLKSSKIERTPSSKFILNYYSYKEAINYDTRDFFRILLIYLLHKQSILHTFFFLSPLEPQSLRICLFIFHYSCDFFMNAFFYLDKKISDRYNYTGNNLYLFSLVNNLVISICSTLISFVFRISLKRLINSKTQIENIFREQEAKMRKKKKIEISDNKRNEIIKKIHKITEFLKIKILVFLIIEFCLMLFFTYYITAFCAIYNSTQISWLSDSVLSFIFTNIIEFLIGFIFAVLYTSSVKYQIKFLFQICVFVYDIGH